jgi:DNA-binding transcriptional ArsR family regulator
VEELISASKALSDSNRVRLLCALRHGELCVCQLIALLKLAPSTVSQHLTILKNAGLISSRKEARWVYYRIQDKPSALCDKMLAMIPESAACSELIAEDDKRLKKILRTDKEQLCRTKE